MGRLVSWAWLLALGLATTAVHVRMPSEPRVLAGGEAFVPSPELAQWLSLGFDAVVGDFHWLRAVQIAGGRDVEPTAQAPLIGRLIDVVTHLDPWVDHPYRFAAVWMTDSLESVRKANQLLERGMAHHPEDWRMPFYKGFNHFFYLEENELAADAMELASSLPGSPAYLGRLVVRLRSTRGDLEAAELMLRQLIAEAPDEQAAAQYRSALDEIEIEARARLLDRAREAYRKLNGRDIARVEDLLLGEYPVLKWLPSAEPSSLPEGLRRGSRWELDPMTGEIRSSYLGRRYELSFHPLEQRRREQWRARREEGDAALGGKDDGRGA